MNSNRKTKNKTPAAAISAWVKKNISAIIVGVIVVALTPFVNNLYSAHEAKTAQKEHLSEIRLGLSKNYTNQILGDPIIENSSQYSGKYNDVTEGEITTAGYKLEDCVVLCMYEDNSLVAFVVVVNRHGVYDVPPVLYMDNWKLLDFTYYDHTDKLDVFQGRITGTNDDFLYYYEVHYGAGPLDYNSYILGSYKDYNDDTWMKMANLTAYIGANEELMALSEEDMATLLGLRQIVKPNVYGIVSRDYVDVFNFVDDIVGSREVGAILFNNW